jgi:SPP1 gp7 family putative phage head morphogenesis protein
MPLKHHLAAGIVTAHRRQQVDRVDRLLARYQRQGVSEATAICWRATQAVLKAYREGRDDLNSILRREILAGVPTLAQSMSVCWATGYDNTQRTAKRGAVTLSLSGFSDMIQFFLRRLALTVEEWGLMESKFNSNALWMYHGASMKAEKLLDKAMVEIARKGLPARQGAMELHKAFEKAGIMPGSSYTIENIYRSQVALAHAAGQRYAQQQPEIDDMLWGFQYCTAGDDRVRPSHQLMEGVTLPKNHRFWRDAYPPNGWSCRCQVVEIYEEEEEVEPEDGPVEIDGKDYYAEADDGFDFDPGELFSDFLQPEKATKKPSLAWQKRAAESWPTNPSMNDIADIVERMTDAERERLADQLGIDEDDLEQGRLSLSQNLDFQIVGLDPIIT